MPKTAQSVMCGCWRRAFSTSTELMFIPPLMITSFKVRPGQLGVEITTSPGGEFAITTKSLPAGLEDSIAALIGERPKLPFRVPPRSTAASRPALAAPSG